MLQANDTLDVAVGLKRKRMLDPLRLFRPLPTQVGPICCTASEMIIRGGNRSGKSVVGAMLFASAARRMPLTLNNGTPAPHFRTPNRPILMWAIGKGEDHIGQTIHRLLFKPNLIPAFRDPLTRQIRAASNYQEKILGEQQGIITDALIPEYEIAKIAWTKPAENVFSLVQLKNGNSIAAYLSTGEVKMGDPVDLIWIDEDIKYAAYVGEWLARLSDNKGRLLWTAWPHAHNRALREMSQRAKEQAHLGAKANVAEFKLRFSDNPFIDEEEKQKRREAWSFSGSAEVRSRDDGDFADGDVLMYPNYTPLVHGIGREGMQPDPLEAELAKTGNVPPADWTHYLIIDPGHSYTAILFFATPPAEFGDHVVLYDELYLRGNDAHQCAKEVKAKVAGKVFSEFVIDGRIARQSSIGVGKTYYQIYQEAFEQAGIRTVVNGAGFTISSDDVSAGVMAVRTWLTIRPNGTAKLRVVKATTPNFHFEIESYRKKITKEETGDKPDDGQRDHAMDDLRYAAMHGCEWRVPTDPTSIAPPEGAYKDFQSWWQGQGQKPKDGTFHCGAGPVHRSAA